MLTGCQSNRSLPPDQFSTLSRIGRRGETRGGGERESGIERREGEEDEERILSRGVRKKVRTREPPEDETELERLSGF
jgi:hypothetical protein